MKQHKVTYNNIKQHKSNNIVYNIQFRNQLTYSQSASKIIMYDSKQSLVPQSIYESRTNHLIIPSKHQAQPLRQTKTKQSQKVIENAGRDSIKNPNFVLDQKEKPFIHYYQQNIRLKKKQEQMVKEIMQLKNKSNAATRSRKQLEENQLKMLATGKKSLWDNAKSYQKRGVSSKGRGISDAHNSRKIEDLLDIIEHYKKKMIISEEQIQNLKRQKHLLEQDGRLKDQKSDQLHKNYRDSSMNPIKAEESLHQQLSKKTRQLQIQKQRNRYLENDTKRLQTKIKNLNISNDQLEDIKLQNRNLQEKLLRLTQLPSFDNITDKVEEERKYKEVNSKYQLLNQKYNSARNQKIKCEAEVKLLQQKLIEINREADNLDKENKKLRAESNDDPILSKLAKDTNLLSKIYYEFINQSQTKGSNKQLGSIQDRQHRQQYQKIIMEKEELANEITTLRSKIEAMQDNWREKERMNKIEKEELAVLYKDKANYANTHTNSINKVMSKNGVSYSDDVSTFSQESNPANLPIGINYFDLYLGDINILETMLRTIFNIQSAENSLILATVDFYNHDTENTKPIHGVNCSFQSQFSFKVQEDQFFFKYLKKGTFYVDVWGLQGNKRHHFGRISIELKPLILKSHRGVAPVISSSVPVYLNQKVMGSINLVMRMRLPIHEQLEKISEIHQMIGSEEQAVNRRLIIHIQEGRGFSESSNTFVYYPFRLEDYYTKTFRGATPSWNHHKTMQLKYNTDLKNYFRKNQLELIVLDDNAAVSGQDGSDLVGTAYVSLLSLLENKPIKERVHVMKGAHRVGTIDIKIYWHDTQASKGPENKKNNIEEATVLEIILNYMKENKLQPEDIFKIIDKNLSGMISFEQFLVWASKIVPGNQVTAINKFYSAFRQPLNHINFTSKLSELKNEDAKDIARQLSLINQEMFKHTYQIDKKQTLEEYLKGKNILDISLQVDKSGDGIISKKQFMQYLDENNVDPENYLEGMQEIKIVEFLKKYQKYI